MRMFTPQNQLFVTDLVLFLQNFDVFSPINTARKNSQKQAIISILETVFLSCFIFDHFQI